MQKSILDIQVSRFANYDTPDNPRPVNLLGWLKTDKYKEQVEQIRQLTDKAERDKIKATLPAITPSGLFTYRKEAALIKHSGLIQFDIDKKDNSNIANYDALKNILPNIKNIAYCGLSVSGQGYWGLIPVAYPEKHKEHFKAIEIAFKNIGIKIDTAPQNVASLRGYSYDPDGYFNHNAIILEKVFVEQQAAPKAYKQTRYTNTTDNDTRAWVEKYINAISAKGIDITDGYKKWLQVGFALATEFGETGRQYFHEVSRNYSGYKPDAADMQYTRCLNGRGQGITIGTFFHLCTAHGVKP